MVPASFLDFFNGCASVAGALIGLLFVALSVSQEKLTGDDARTEHQVRAAAAFSALVNTLVIALRRRPAGWRVPRAARGADQPAGRVAARVNHGPFGGMKNAHPACPFSPDLLLRGPVRVHRRRVQRTPGGRGATSAQPRRSSTASGFRPAPR